MDLIVNEFLLEINDIENLTDFIDISADNDADNHCEPKTDWLEEIDSRTNFPFYWNSNTKESVWDMPKEYKEYLIKYETYLRDLMEKLNEIRRLKRENDNEQKMSDMKGLIGYSDSSEDELIDESSPTDNNNNEDNLEIVNESPMETETQKDTEEQRQQEEQREEEELALKRDRWICEQSDEAERYLRQMICRLSETLARKVESLRKDGFGTSQLTEIAVRVATRLEDWTDGHLTLERKVEKLKESLIELSRFEMSLETDKWVLNWNSEKNQYFCMSLDTGKTISELSATKMTCEEGEIVEDEDDIALDLEEYVSTTLHRSFLDENHLNESEEIQQLPHSPRLTESSSVEPNKPTSPSDELVIEFVESGVNCADSNEVIDTADLTNLSDVNNV